MYWIKSAAIIAELIFWVIIFCVVFAALFLLISVFSWLWRLFCLEERRWKWNKIKAR